MLLIIIWILIRVFLGDLEIFEESAAETFTTSFLFHSLFTEFCPIVLLWIDSGELKDFFILLFHKFGFNAYFYIYTALILYMIQFMLCFSRQGRVRLERWYSADFEVSRREKSFIWLLRFVSVAGCVSGERFSLLFSAAVSARRSPASKERHCETDIGTEAWRLLFSGVAGL